MRSFFFAALVVLAFANKEEFTQKLKKTNSALRQALKSLSTETAVAEVQGGVECGADEPTCGSWCKPSGRGCCDSDKVVNVGGDYYCCTAGTDFNFGNPICSTGVEKAVGGSCSLSMENDCDTSYVTSWYGGNCGFSYSQKNADDTCVANGRSAPASGFKRVGAKVEFCCGTKGNCHSGYSNTWGYEHSHADRNDPNGFLGEVRVSSRGACSDHCIAKHGTGTMYNYHYQGVCRCYSHQQGTRVWNALNDYNIWYNMLGVNAWTFCKVPYNP